jgi:hypothetical protein
MSRHPNAAPLDEPPAAAPLYVVGWAFVVLSIFGLGWLLLITTNGLGSGATLADWLCVAGGIFAGFVLIGVGALLTEMRAIRRLVSNEGPPERPLPVTQAARPRANADEEWKKA